MAKKQRKPVPGWVVGGGVTLFRLLRRTWRVTVDDRTDFFTTGEPWPMVAALWHNRIPLLVNFFPAALQRRAAALASASGDGEIAAQVLRAFQYTVVRGSSSRGGHAALYNLKECLKNGLSTAITVDGPRGPRYSVHPGAMLLGEWTGVPVVPLCINAPRRWELRSWDRTQIPKPFSRVTFVIGEPLAVPPDLDPDQRRTECERLRTALLAITDDAPRAGTPAAATDG